MKKVKRMALCDTDRGYVYHLQDLLEHRDSFPFTVCAYTEVEAFMEHYGKGEFSVILAGREFYERIKTDEKAILLRATEEEQEGERSVWKYQSAAEIRRQLMEFCSQSDEEGSAVRGNNEVSVIGVFSPVCREIQTSFSLLLGQFLAKRGSALYLNMEPFSELSHLGGMGGGKDLTDLVYFLEGGREKLAYYLESLVGNVNGLDYVAPAFSFIDLSEVSAECWIKLISSLREMKTYKYIILDLSELVDGLLDVLRACDCVYTIANKEGFALARLEKYEELLKHLEYADVFDHTQRCDLPPMHKLASGIEELPYTDLAGYVKRLAEEFAW